MKKRIAKKILKNKDKLNYSPRQIAEAEKKMSKVSSREITEEK